MKTKTKWTLLLAVFLSVSCREGGGGPTGTVSLKVRYAQSFDPNAVNAEVVEYRVTVFSDSLPLPVLKVFPAGTPSATFTGFAGGAEVNVLVEYVNGDGAVIRRGRSAPVVIRAGTDTPVVVTVNNVPIFTNVKDGATVVGSRFVPRVFAPGISFEIEDGFNGAVSLLPDVIDGALSFSVGEGNVTQVLPVRVPPLSVGDHVLTVRDPGTGEATSVRVRAVERSGKRALTTTAGGYAGSILGDGAKVFNLPEYFRLMAGE